jgi:hypothetical protein
MDITSTTSTYAVSMQILVQLLSFLNRLVLSLANIDINSVVLFFNDAHLQIIHGIYTTYNTHTHIYIHKYLELILSYINTNPNKKTLLRMRY